MSLAQRTEASRAGRAGQVVKRRGPFEVVVRDVLDNRVARLSVSIDIDLHCPRGMNPINLNELVRQPAGAHLGEQAMTQFIVADAADDHGMMAELMTVKCEVKRRSARLRPAWQQVPEQFADADDRAARRHASSSLGCPRGGSFAEKGFEAVAAFRPQPRRGAGASAFLDRERLPGELP